VKDTLASTTKKRNKNLHRESVCRCVLTSNPAKISHFCWVYNIGAKEQSLPTMKERRFIEIRWRNLQEE
jgi:hypothetical protein